MAISPVAFSNEMCFRFIGHVLCKDDDYTHESNMELAKKWAAQFGFTLDYINPEMYDAIEAYSAFNDGPEALEVYIQSCSLKSKPLVEQKE